MGKPYATELARIPETYAWASSVDIGELVHAVSGLAPLPLLVVGSGGSFTAAHFAATLHERHTGRIARPMTPFEFVDAPIDIGDAGVLVLTAGGNNADIVAALESAAAREAKRCVLVCFRAGSRASRMARRYPMIDAIDGLRPPAGKDGFLATNSLVALSMLLVRAYQETSRSPLPTGTPAPPTFEPVETLQNLVQLQVDPEHPIWSRDTILVLYDPGTQAAAIDIESKFSEAALRNVHIADYRNFAHGRHHWLAKRADDSGVLALFTESHSALAIKTLDLLPGDVPALRVRLPDGTSGALAGLFAALLAVLAGGKACGIDPGRPGVPEFGRRIYRLRGLRAVPPQARSAESVAIARKLRCDIRFLEQRSDLAAWSRAYATFCKGLAAARIGAVALDYDGTLCDERDRFAGPRPAIGEELARLLRSNVLLGIATGRGRSVRNDLRRLLPDDTWPRVVIGYYNGADLGLLDDDAHPESAGQPVASIAEVASRLTADTLLSGIAQCEVRRTQVSIRPTTPGNAPSTWRRVIDIASSGNVAVVRSSHSIDVLAQSVTKTTVVDHLAALVAADQHVLAIGDKGEWPGNDFALLSTRYSLSVDEASVNPATCWNIAPRSSRGAAAALHYLRSLRASESGCQLDLRVLRRARPGSLG